MIAKCGGVQVVDTSGWTLEDAERAVATGRANLVAAQQLDVSFRDAPRDVRDDVVRALREAQAQLVEAQAVLRAVRARTTRAA